MKELKQIVLEYKYTSDIDDLLSSHTTHICAYLKCSYMCIFKMQTNVKPLDIHKCMSHP